MKLRLEPPDGFQPDDIYAGLLEIGRNRTDREARRAMAALALLLINHIADEEVVNDALSVVRKLPSIGDTQREENHA